MHRILRIMRTALLGAAAVAAFVVSPHGQSILGPASEANNFIETPKGWVHPTTPWGEPDIQANLNMMQAAGVPLERCANATRFGGPPCDMNKAWWTEDEYKQRIAAASGRGGAQWCGPGCARWRITVHHESGRQGMALRAHWVSGWSAADPL